MVTKKFKTQKRINENLLKTPFWYKFHEFQFTTLLKICCFWTSKDLKIRSEILHCNCEMYPTASDVTNCKGAVETIRRSCFAEPTLTRDLQDRLIEHHVLVHKNHESDEDHEKSVEDRCWMRFLCTSVKNSCFSVVPSFRAHSNVTDSISCKNRINCRT